MGDFNPLVLPIPKIFILDPHSEHSPTATCFMNAIGEYDTIPVSETFEESVSPSYMLFNRFPLPALFYMFGNYGPFSLSSFIAKFGNYTAGYIISLDLQHLEFTQPNEYTTIFKRYLKELEASASKPYLIALGNPNMQAWDETHLRQAVRIPQNIPIFEHDESPKQVSLVFQELFKLSTDYDDEQKQILLHHLSLV